MSRHPQFAQWLAAAMRRADLDIDKQRGGGRAELAERLEVSRSTITRWLEGGSLPGPEYFEALSEALDVYVDDMLVDGGIVKATRMSPREGRPAASRSTSYEIERAAEILGVPPGLRKAYVRMMKSMALLAGSTNTAAILEGEDAPTMSEDYLQRGASPTFTFGEPPAE